MRTSLGIFLKAPRPGTVKTRLQDRLGAEGAAALYRAFVQDVVTLARSAQARQRILYWAGAAPATWADELGPGSAELLRAWPAREQSEGDLGARLQAAFEAEATGPLLVVGTDSPDLPADHLARALQALEGGADAAFGPAQDGGVWCIGLRRAPRGFFADLPWSSAETGDALRNRARAHALEPVDLDPWYDCDTSADLQALATRLRTGRSKANMTQRWLRDHLRGDPGPHPTSTP